MDVRQNAGPSWARSRVRSDFVLPGRFLASALGFVLLLVGGVDCSEGAEDLAAGDAETGDETGDSGQGSVRDGGGEALGPFSFFVTSLRAIQRLSNSPQGFGGDLRFGRADGLSGADEICRQVAEASMPGSSIKGWRAFLSVTRGSDGTPVNAIDRVGEGPWYDRVGRLVAANKADLLQPRPRTPDKIIAYDLPNEHGIPNHNPEGTGQVDNHDALTGSNASGELYKLDGSCTCRDWTSSVGSDGRPRVGHTWPRASTLINLDHWISSLDEAGCGAGINLVETGAPDPKNPTVGSGGGYGGFYCLALTP